MRSLTRLTFYSRVLGFLLLALLGMVIFMADDLAQRVTIPLKHPVCCQTPADFAQGSPGRAGVKQVTGAGASYENITFMTADGLALSGWYIPPRNGAVIILLHTYYSDRIQTLPVARMLYQGGYGVLMYDQRASGQSQGEARSLGWLDIPDLRAAAQWLSGREKNLKIGAYGCSMGGAIALAGAVGAPDIQAIAADAPSPMGWTESIAAVSSINLPTFNPLETAGQMLFTLPVIALYYPLVMLHSYPKGAVSSISLPPTSTIQAVQDNGAKALLFISSGSDEELARVSRYDEAARGPHEHWNIPEAGHCGGPFARPQEYQQHLLNFFNKNLYLQP